MNKKQNKIVDISPKLQEKEEEKILPKECRIYCPICKGDNWQSLRSVKKQRNPVAICKDCDRVHVIQVNDPLSLQMGVSFKLKVFGNEGR